MFPEGRGVESRQLGRGVGDGETPPCPRGDRDSRTDSRAGFGPSSRSLRAERWRRRRRRKRRRRRGRSSRHGQEPCQEKTTSQLSPSIPAAVRTVTGPPALLPPLSPHLGPIVWLGAPGGGGGKDAETATTARKRRGGKTRRRKRGRGVGLVVAAEGEGSRGRGALR